MKTITTPPNLYYAATYPNGRRSLHCALTEAEALAHAAGTGTQIRVFGRGPTDLKMARDYVAGACVAHHAVVAVELVEEDIDAPFVVTMTRAN